MKKLQLKLEGKEMLSKEQMKQIQGGYGNCTASCPDGGYVICWYDTSGSCSATEGVGCEASWSGGSASASC